jgi:hypothetical protein
MTTLKRVVANGTTLYPTEIEVTETRIADSERMLSGKFRMWHRAFKNTWKLSWTSLPETSLAAIRAVYRTTTTFTFNDENNTNWTVASTEFSTTLSAEQISRSGIIYYDVSLTLEEE